jgi:hypothetical protein
MDPSLDDLLMRDEGRIEGDASGQSMRPDWQVMVDDLVEGVEGLETRHWTWI